MGKLLVAKGHGSTSSTEKKNYLSSNRDDQKAILSLGPEYSLTTAMVPS